MSLPPDESASIAYQPSDRHRVHLLPPTLLRPTWPLPLPRLTVPPPPLLDRVPRPPPHPPPRSVSPAAHPRASPPPHPCRPPRAALAASSATSLPTLSPLLLSSPSHHHPSYRASRRRHSSSALRPHLRLRATPLRSNPPANYSPRAVAQLPYLQRHARSPSPRAARVDAIPVALCHAEPRPAFRPITLEWACGGEFGCGGGCCWRLVGGRGQHRWWLRLPPQHVAVGYWKF